MQDGTENRPIFVSRHTAAKLMEISVDTFDQWVRSGYVPRAVINRGQIIRWHWPSVEDRLVEWAKGPQVDPSIILPEQSPEELARIQRHVERKEAKRRLRAGLSRYEGPPELRRKLTDAP